MGRFEAGSEYTFSAELIRNSDNLERDNLRIHNVWDVGLQFLEILKPKNLF